MIARCALPPVCREEILRYAGAKAETPELSSLLTQTLAETEGIFSTSVCWQEFPVALQGDDTVDLTFSTLRSRSLARHLQGCCRVVVFAATVGLPLDRLILRYGKTAPAKALLLQAIGAERIEALCGVFQEQLRERVKAESLSITGRFSPGYGDLPLTVQRELFDVLDCSRQIGLTLNDSLLMSPSKSVTAIIGIGSHCRNHSGSGCAGCTKTDCIHRRTP